MPILWRYALQSYSRVFFLSICTFIAVLILSRFSEIARFTALSGAFSQTGIYILYQVPLILPMAIPISSLLASFLLFQALSRSSELTALRASGMSLWTILTPLLFTSLLLTIFNFSICNGLAPFCRREGKTLIYQATSENPLLLMQRQKLIKIKHAYLNMKVKDDETLKDFILIAYNERNRRLNLYSAQKLFLRGGQLLGQNLAIVSTVHADTGFDPLIIENQSTMSTSAPLLSTALKKNRPRLDLNAHSLKMLRIKSIEEGRNRKSPLIEILRRVSLSLSVFSFTFLGCVFAIETRRGQGIGNILIALSLTLMILASYLLGNHLKNWTRFAIFAFLLPHLISWFCSAWQLGRISKGLA